MKDKVAIVCGAGASAGGVSIGMATAITLAREGAKVFAVDRDLALARDTERRIRDAGGECVLHECDVADGAAVARMADACAARFGRIDVLFNNVGVFLTVKAVLPAMLRQGSGAIVNNASVSAVRYQMPSVAYSMSKAGVLQLTQNVGLQYAAKGIRCNSVLPGNILTDRLVTRLRATFGDAYVDHVRAWGEQVPSGQVGEPWDVANAVLFLASDEAKYVNCIELKVDGGLSASAVGHKL